MLFSYRKLRLLYEKALRAKMRSFVRGTKAVLPKLLIAECAKHTFVLKRLKYYYHKEIFMKLQKHAFRTSLFLLLFTMLLGLFGTAAFAGSAAAQTTEKRTSSVTYYKGKKNRAELVKYSKKTRTVIVKLYNGSNKTNWYGYGHSLQKYVKGKWKTVKPKVAICWTEEAMSVPSHCYTILEYKLAPYYTKKSLSSGKYRLRINYMVGKKSYQYVKFTIK